MIPTYQYLITGQALTSAKSAVAFWGKSWNTNNFASENDSLHYLPFCLKKGKEISENFNNKEKCIPLLLLFH